MTRTNSPAPIIILAEDRRQARFIRAYLRHRLPAVHQRDIFDAPMEAVMEAERSGFLTITRLKSARISFGELDDQVRRAPKNG